MNYPLNLKFKFFTVIPQVYIKDSAGNTILYVRQKLFKLKESVAVFADESRQKVLYNINADRIIDFSARYTIKDEAGNEIAAVKRNGMKSLWKASYDIFTGGDHPVFSVKEENPFIKFIDAIFSQLPIIGMFAGLLFHPQYVVFKASDNPESPNPILRLTKKPAFTERHFSIEKISELTENDEKKILACLLMILLLEKTRG